MTSQTTGQWRLPAGQGVRFLLAGIWNSFAGWAVFALSWLALHEHVPLWGIIMVAHAMATTQAFLVQRHLVFDGARAPATVQFLRFQAAYGVQLVLGMLLVTGLAAEGIHPLLAQLIAMAVLAFCGFFLGRDYVFSKVPLSFRPLHIRLRWCLRRERFALLFFLWSLAAFERFWGGRFYASTDHLGHDFTLSSLALLEGRFWIQSNGLLSGLFNPPWFTPAWCAGTAFYADPQAAFYSPLQAFALWMDPFAATHLNALLMATVAFWGCYALARRVLGWLPLPAAVFAVLGMANAFMPMRSAVGELGYQPLYLWPLLVLALCWPTAQPRGSTLAGPAIGVALCLTAWLQFGFAGMMVPIFLGCLLLSFAVVWSGRVELGAVVMRATLGGCLAIVTNASKLYESASLMRQFPRDFYALPGFASLRDATVAAVLALLQPSEWTAHFGTRHLSHVRFAVLPHEWALEFGLGALAAALLCCAAMLFLRRGERLSRAPMSLSSRKFLALSGMLLIAALPLLLLWDQVAVRAALKSIPILNSAAWPMRWVVIWLPAMQYLLAVPVRKLGVMLPAHAMGISALATALIWAGPATAPVDYYLSSSVQSYDPAPVRDAARRSLVQGPVPISSIAVWPADRLFAHRNDTMLEGGSQALCYNPLYGYRLESFPQRERLRDGPALAADQQGRTLLFNPACLVHPKENSCKPGDGFQVQDAAQMRNAERFLERKPFAWQRPMMGAALSWLSQATAWFLFALVVTWAARHLSRLMRPPVPRS